MKPSFIFRFWCRLHKRRVVAMRRPSGEVFWSYAIDTPFGDTGAYVYPFTKTGWAVLNDNGTISNHYLTKWAPWPSPKSDKEHLA